MADLTKEFLGGDARFDELMGRVRSTSVGKSVSASEWQEIEQFVQENLKTPGEMQGDYDSGYEAGMAEMLRRAKLIVLDKAADAFKAGNDARATDLRELSKGLL